MQSPMQAIGFSGLEDEYPLEELVNLILDEPTVKFGVNVSDEYILAEYYREFAECTYMMARMVVSKVGGTPKIRLQQCEPFVEGENTLEVVDVQVECLDDENTYYVICEEKETGMQFVFWLQNVVEYLDMNEDEEDIEAVKIVGLAVEGTIILPIEKEEEDEEEEEGRQQFREMLQRAREGDKTAQNILDQEEKEMDDLLRERLRQEDFLSIMSGYFIPTTLVNATYAILGEILAIKERVNIRTKEKMYLFLLNVNDMLLEVMINQNTLVGMPSVGMRFMGTCWLQGKLIT